MPPGDRQSQWRIVCPQIRHLYGIQIKPSVRGNACEVFSGWYGRRLQHSVSVHTRMHLAHNLYIWTFLAVLLGSTSAQPFSENAIHGRSSDTLRRRSSSGPPNAQLSYEELRKLWLGFERGKGRKDLMAWNHWNEWIVTCATYNWDGETDHGLENEWCNHEYMRQKEEGNGALPEFPKGPTRPPGVLLKDDGIISISQQPSRRPRQKTKNVEGLPEVADNTPTSPQTRRQKIAAAWQHLVDKFKGGWQKVKGHFFRSMEHRSSPVGPGPRYPLPAGVH